MAPHSYSFNTPTNPVLQVLYFVLGGIVLIGAVIMGAFILAIALGIAIVVGVIVYARVWWLKRTLRRAGGPFGGPSGRSVGGGSTSDSEVLEVEYTVVDERDDRPGRE